MLDEQTVRLLESRLTHWSLLVVIGVVLEVVNEGPKLYAILRTVKRLDWVTLRYKWSWPSAEVHSRYEPLLAFCGISGTILIIIGLAGELRTQATLSSVQHRIRVNLYGQVRDAIDGATNATNRAATAQDDAAAANGRVAMALAELTVVTTPRSPIAIFDTPKGSPISIAPLEEFKGQSIFVQSINEEEPNELAGQLKGLVSSCRWTVKSSARPLSAAGIERGIVIWTVHANFRTATPAELRANNAADGLSKYLKSVGVWNIRRQTGDVSALPLDSVARLDTTAIVVLVGLRDTQGEVGAWVAGSRSSPAWSRLR